MAATELPRSPGHTFYDKLNQLLAEAAFDRRCEELCAPYYAAGTGRPGIAPGVYFRMLFVGYFEGLSAQRAIAWKCADSLSVRTFLGLEVTAAAPDHSSLTRIRQRLPLEVHVQAFQWVLEVAQAKGVLRGKVLAIDATTLEANAAMKSMVRRVSGEKWMAYLRRLAKAEGMDDPSDEDLRRFDRKRKDKKVSNAEWASPIDPDSRIVKMKDGRTHFGYKAEHAVDLASDLAVAAEIYPGDTADGDTALMTVQTAQDTLAAIGGAAVEAVVGDKGYHRIESLAVLREVHGVRTYIPERADHLRHNWRDRPAGDQVAFYLNRRRMQRAHGRALSRRRSEYVERSFAHACETGGGRRVWVRGIENVRKRYLLHLAARNLGVLMRALFGVGTPRSLQGRLRVALGALNAVLSLLRARLGAFVAFTEPCIAATRVSGFATASARS
ncbi:MAG TPA: transposase [Rhizomicrobium sp.]